MQDKVSTMEWKKKQQGKWGYSPPVIMLQYPFLCWDIKTASTNLLPPPQYIYLRFAAPLLFVSYLPLQTALGPQQKTFKISITSYIADKSIWNIKCTGARGIQIQIILKFMIQLSTFAYLITQEVLCNWQSPPSAHNPFTSSIFTKKVGWPWK